jgi:hypothetical protein
VSLSRRWNVGQLRRVLQQRVKQRAVPITAARMYHQTRRFVDDHQVRVFENDVNRDILRTKRRNLRIDFSVQLDLFAAPHLVFGRRGEAIQRNTPGLKPTG